ncbi:MAG: multidrug effflux MFS transporter [Burkholderiales bacterium]|nr:multidrug effflux MFS transporter [Burkholderiales bacterium]
MTSAPSSRATGTAPTPGPASEPRYVVLLALLLGSQPVATDLYLPALPTIAAQLGNPALTLTGLTLFFGFAQLVLGPLSDRLGRRPVLLAGCAGYALTSFVGAWVDTLAALIVCRCLQGVAMAAMVVCARASIRDLYAPLEGARVFSRGLTGLGFLALSSPLVGALVVSRVSWHAAFAVLGVFGLATFAWVWFFYDESRPAPNPGAKPVTTLEATRIVLASARFRAWTAVLCTSYGTLFCFLLASGFVYIQVFGFSTLACGMVLAGNSVCYIGGTYACRRLLLRMSPDRAVTLSAGFSVGGGLFMLVAALARGTPEAWAMIVGQYLFAIGHGVNQPCAQVGAVAEFPELAGRAAALSGCLMMVVAFGVGQAMAPFLGSSAWPLIVANTLGGSLVALSAWGLVRHSHRDLAAQAV